MRLPVIAAVLCLIAGSAAATTTYQGRALPFKIITAIRNYGFAEGMRPAQVAISVEGGTQGDWLATAAYVAEKAIVADVTFSTVEVYFPSPWGDKPPTRTKQLAKAYYAGPDPRKSPWPDKPWVIFAAGHSPTLADVEFDVLSDHLLGLAGPSDDPDKASAAADSKARAMIIRKYHLAKMWKPDQQVGALDPNEVDVSREQITITDTTGADSSIRALSDCLTKSDDGRMFRGCQDVSEDYVGVR